MFALFTQKGSEYLRSKAIFILLFLDEKKQKSFDRT